MRLFCLAGILLFVLLPLSGKLHPYYIGVTELHFYPDKMRVEMSVKIFTDDLEDAIRAYSKQPVDLIRQQGKPETDQAIFGYLGNRIRLDGDGKLIRFGYIGYELIDDACWIHWEAAIDSVPRNISFFNNAIYERQPTQQHILHFYWGDKKKSGRIYRERDLFSFSW